MRRLWKLTMVAALGALLTAALAACGSDPTPTPTATPKPVTGGDPTATPTPAGRDMEAYFSGKTIRIMVGFSPGGGYDTVSRIFAAVAPRHFPGNPRFIVTNLPGSGGLRALQETMKATPDGFTVNPMATRFIVPEVIGEDVEGFDLFKANLIGTATTPENHAGFCMKKGPGVPTTYAEMVASGKTYVTGQSSPGGDVIGAALVEIKGGPIKVVYGYTGTSDLLAAMDRGELDGTSRCDFVFMQPLFPEWIENQQIQPVFYFRNPMSEEWLRALGATQPPHLFDLLDLTEEEEAAFTLGDTAEAQTRLFTLAPDVPEDIVEQWRASFKAVVDDPEFIQRMTNGGLEVGYGDPVKLVELLRKGQNFGAQAKDMLRQIYGL